MIWEKKSEVKDSPEITKISNEIRSSCTTLFYIHSDFHTQCTVQYILGSAGVVDILLLLCTVSIEKAVSKWSLISDQRTENSRLPIMHCSKDRTEKFSELPLSNFEKKQLSWPLYGSPSLKVFELFWKYKSEFNSVDDNSLHI